MVAFTMLIVMVAIDLGAQNHLMQGRAERLRIARNAFDGEIDSLVNAGKITTTYTLPTTLNVTIGSAAGSYTITNNNANITGTVLVAGSITVGSEKYALSKVIGNGIVFVANLGPWNYAIFDDGSLNPEPTIAVGSASDLSNVYAGGNLSTQANGSIFYGNLQVVGLINGGSITVNGTKTNPASAQTFPSMSGANYQNAAYSYNYNNNVTVNGLTFPTVSASANYPIYAYNSNLTLSGTITGRGIIFAWGNVVISGNITYAANSTLVLVTPNQVSVSAGVTQIHGYIYCGSQFECTPSVTLTGAVLANSFGFSAAETFLYDDYISTTSGEANRLCLPGLWP